MVKTKKILQNLQAGLKKNDLDLVQGVGAFKGGYCVINDNPVVVVNKRMPVEEQAQIIATVFIEQDLDTSCLKTDACALIDRIKK